MSYEKSCRNFSGYKPCGLSESCDSNCRHRDVVQSRILIVHLGALGAVARATSLLPSIKRKFPKGHITWITEAPAHHLLKHNGLIDSVKVLNQKSILELSTLQFDFGFCIDKCQQAYGVMKQTTVDIEYGFGVDEVTGSIKPLNSEAQELWEIGLSDNKKFYENKKPETQLMIEAFDLGSYQFDDYQIILSPDELSQAQGRRERWSPKGLPIIGINTGCANTIRAKKLPVLQQKKLIVDLQKSYPGHTVVLLGGPEDSDRNWEIAEGLTVVSSATEQGIRDGLISMQACDIVITGDSLGMHMAIGLKKWVIAWFGPTCAHEIELYGRGEAVIADVGCAPCWKRDCEKSVMCYDRVDFKKIIRSVKKGFNWLTSSSKQHSSEMHF